MKRRAFLKAALAVPAAAAVGRGEPLKTYAGQGVMTWAVTMRPPYTVGPGQQAAALARFDHAWERLRAVL